MSLKKILAHEKRKVEAEMWVMVSFVLLWTNVNFSVLTSMCTMYMDFISWLLLFNNSNRVFPKKTDKYIYILMHRALPRKECHILQLCT